MRILHINCNYIGTTLHQLMIEKLDELGVENEVFVPTYDRSISEINVNDNVYVSECFKKSDRIIFDYKQSKIIKAIEEHYDVKSFDLIHAYTLFTDGNAARVLSEKYGVPYVVAVRNTDVNDFFKKMIHLRKRGIEILRHAKKIFFLSDAYKNQVFEKYIPSRYNGELLGKVEIVPNGIDEFWFDNFYQENRSINPMSLKLVTACTVDKNKNIVATQEAIKILKSEGYNISLIVAGKIVNKSLYEKISQDNNTYFVGKKNKKELLDIYRNSDIFVMPSIHESFGLVYVEAMTQGLPVIYTKNQGFDQQFPEGHVGYHVDSSSSLSISDAIKKVVCKYNIIYPRTCEASKKFKWGNIVNIYYSTYTQIIDSDYK